MQSFSGGTEVIWDRYQTPKEASLGMQDWKTSREGVMMAEKRKKSVAQDLCAA